MAKGTIKLNRYGLPINKNTISIKQLEALQKGRAKLAEKNEKKIAKAYSDLVKKELELNQEKKSHAVKIKYTYQQFKEEVKIRKSTKVERDDGTFRTPTTKEVIEGIKATTAFMSRDELFIRSFRDYLTVSDRNRIRYGLSKLYGTPYKQTKINWGEFYYEKAIKGLMHTSGTITLYHSATANSTSSSFIVVNVETID